VFLLLIPAILVYFSLISGAEALWPQYWSYIPPTVFILYFSIAVYTKRPAHAASALFASGILIAWAVARTDVSWLHILYIPYVSLAGVFGISAILWILVSVPLLEITHFIGTGPVYDEVALLALCVLAAGIAVVTRWVALPQKKQPHPVLTEHEPPDMNGLKQVEDTEVKDFLRTVLYSMHADAVSLYMLDDKQELELTASTTIELDKAPPLWFVENALRFRHLVSTNDTSSAHVDGTPAAGASNPGNDGPEGLSAVAIPVIDGNIILGVVGMTGHHQNPDIDEPVFHEDQHMALELLAGQFARTLGRRRVQAENELHMERLRTIQEESARLVTSLDMVAIVDMVAEAVERLAPNADLYIFIKGTGGFALAYDRTEAPAAREIFSLEGTLMEMAVADKEQKYFSNLLGYSVPVMPMEAEVASALMLPLKYEDEVLGVITLVSQEVDMLVPRQVDSLRVIADQASISLKNGLFHAEIKARALTDGLTGLCNHKHFKSVLKEEFKRYSTGMSSLALLIVDIDHFKRVNDTHGHQAGDEVLRGVSKVLKSAVRELDLPARYGGEEFTVLMVDASQSEAKKVAERIRQKVEATAFASRGGAIRVTVSIGLASCTMDIKDSSDLLERADKALYQAKDRGRNRTIVAGVPLEEPAIEVPEADIPVSKYKKPPALTKHTGIPKKRSSKMDKFDKYLR
jgi:diguanylate cyclase (GGDEF)-like protein